ncbi:hypothetical protein [Mycolicibacterium sp.]|uniref:hypothetical protein n=1 Tax=Mycolicibacterium sp. TaxID=2320850 RepID=UPI003D0E6F17
MRFNPPPNWPVPSGWTPPQDWRPDPSWPPAPEGWQYWIDEPATTGVPATAGTPGKPLLLVTVVSLIVALIAVGSTVYLLVNRPAAEARQLEEILPSDSEIGPRGVDVDSSGAVYVADALHTDDRDGRVLKIAPGASQAETLPFPPLQNAVGLVVDDADTVFVADSGGDTVYQLPQGATAATTIPFTDLKSPEYLAVDSEGTLYVVEATRRAVRTLSRSGEETTYPAVTDDGRFWNGITVKEPGVILASTFVQTPSADGDATISDPLVTEIDLRTGARRNLTVADLHQPTGLAYDADGNLFVGNYYGSFGSVLRLTPEGVTDVVPFSGSVSPEDLAVAPDGSLVMTDMNLIRRLSNYRFDDQG